MESGSWYEESYHTRYLCRCTYETFLFTLFCIFPRRNLFGILLITCRLVLNFNNELEIERDAVLELCIRYWCPVTMISDIFGENCIKYVKSSATVSGRCIYDPLALSAK